MIAYAGITLAAYCLALIGNGFGNKSKAVKYLFLALSIGLFCYYAGARDITVGSDTSGYALGSYHAAISMDFFTFFFESDYQSWFSPFYRIICWLSSNIGGSFFWYMFCVQLCTVLPVYIVSYKVLDARYAPFALIVYGLIFYPMSLNMMRQMISMSILLFAFVAANDRRPVAFCAYLIVAMLFHGSAFIGAFLYPLVIVCTSKSSRLSSGLRLLVITVLSLLLVALAPYILRFTDSVGIYSAYTSGKAVVDGGGRRAIVLTVLLAVILIPLGLLFIRRSDNSSRLSMVGLVATVMFGIICMPLSVINFYLFRIGIYFLYLVILAIPTCISLIRERKTTLFFELLVVALLFIWANDYYAVQGLHNVIPYHMNSWKV